jgi:hypothetical protein
LCLSFFRSAWSNQASASLSWWDSLLTGGDRFMVLADFADYASRQDRAAVAYLDPESWA